MNCNLLHFGSVDYLTQHTNISDNYVVIGVALYHDILLEDFKEEVSEQLETYLELQDETIDLMLDCLKTEITQKQLNQLVSTIDNETLTEDDSFQWVEFRM